MARDEKISLGVHLVGIAYRHGHRSVDDVWQHPVNESLRDTRRDPAVLAQGDVVHVPDARPWVFKGLQTRRTHELVLELPIPIVRLALRRPGGTPYAGVQCTVGFDDTTRRITTDDGGTLTFEVNPDTTSATVMFDLQALEIRIAHLQPADLVVGCIARLANVGYRPGGIDNGAAADPYALRSAIEEFQCDQALAVNGELDDATREALLAAHGA